MIDLHCHLLPGVDDGSRSVAQSVAVLNKMAAAGVKAVCLTPHLLASQADGGVPPLHDAAYQKLTAATPSGIILARGVELMLDRPLGPHAAGDRRLTLGGSRYLLVEFTPLVSYPAASAALQQVVSLGLIPVLAHPERYPTSTPANVKRWKELGAVMQVDATTLFRPRTRGLRARALLEYGLADILAADNHGDERLLDLPFRLLSRQRGQEQAELLVKRNPAAILADGTVQAVPPFIIRTSWLTQIRDLFDTNE